MLKYIILVILLLPATPAFAQEIVWEDVTGTLACGYPPPGDVVFDGSDNWSACYRANYAAAGVTAQQAWEDACNVFAAYFVPNQLTHWACIIGDGWGRLSCNPTVFSPG